MTRRREPIKRELPSEPRPDRCKGRAMLDAGGAQLLEELRPRCPLEDRERFRYVEKEATGRHPCIVSMVGKRKKLPLWHAYADRPAIAAALCRSLSLKAPDVSELVVRGTPRTRRRSARRRPARSGDPAWEVSPRASSATRAEQRGREGPPEVVNAELARCNAGTGDKAETTPKVK